MVEENEEETESEDSNKSLNAQLKSFGIETI